MKIEAVLKKVLGNVKVSEGEMKELREESSKFISKLEENIKKNKIRASVFLGGSLAKGTVIKKKKYDIDIFVRFDSSYRDSEISDILSRVISGNRIHGSRDYFQIKKGDSVFEIIPVVKIKKPKEARNITDLSYFHVEYILNKVKENPNLGNEIILAKAFCHAQKCYGAESYIRGFSGYALELLVSHYKSFLKFVQDASKKERILIDDSGFYKNKGDIETSMNEAKLESPIILVDPTFKERNALAALSKETYSRFREACKRFLKAPSEGFFSESRINEKSFNLILEASSSKQEGDIAGSKLRKFFNSLKKELESNFAVKNSEFEYEKLGRFYFKLRKMKKLEIRGPPINNVENLLKFKEKHKQVFIKKNIAYSLEKPKSVEEIVKNLNKIMKPMGISGLRIVKTL